MIFNALQARGAAGGGQQNWAAQKAWAETTLDGFAGSNDWRLPDIAEYANLFTAYGDLASNTLPFVDVQRDFYWSGTEFTPGIFAWYFIPVNGFHDGGFYVNRFFAVAVHPGDVAARVPEPQTLALALLALGATVVARSTRPARRSPQPRDFLALRHGPP